MIRAYIYIYIVFYSALIFVCNAYSYDTRIRRIRMIRALVYASLVMIRVFRYSIDNDMRNNDCV
jgi:hypothetical protein